MLKQSPGKLLHCSLMVYVKATQEYSLAHSPEFQKEMRLIMELCLSARFDMYPKLLVTDGHPLDIQSLFYAPLRSAKESRKYQTWTIAGFLFAREVLDNPHYLDLISFERLSGS